MFLKKDFYAHKAEIIWYQKYSVNSEILLKF